VDFDLLDAHQKLQPEDRDIERGYPDFKGRPCVPSANAATEILLDPPPSVCDLSVFIYLPFSYLQFLMV